MADRSAWEGVLFDLGNTLVPFTPRDSMEFVVKWYHSSGMDVPFSHFLSSFREVSRKERRRSLDESWESSVPERSKMMAEELEKRGFRIEGTEDSLARSHTSSFTSCLRMRSSSRYVLDMITSMEGPDGGPVRTGLVSNAMDARAIRDFLRREDLMRYFGSVVISEEAGMAKPKKEIFLKALNELGIGPRRSLYVGDRYHTDIVGSRSAGMKAVYIREYTTAGEPPEDIDLDLTTIKNLLDLLPLLESDNIG